MIEKREVFGMSRMYIPEGYKSALNLKETQIAIKK